VSRRRRDQRRMVSLREIGAFWQPIDDTSDVENAWLKVHPIPRNWKGNAIHHLQLVQICITCK
jgi:hypothetical protein